MAHSGYSWQNILENIVFSHTIFPNKSRVKKPQYTHPSSVNVNDFAVILSFNCKF